MIPDGSPIVPAAGEGSRGGVDVSQGCCIMMDSRMHQRSVTGV